MAVGFQAGLFNIGANGQMHMGGMAALWVGFTVSAPRRSSTFRWRSGGDHRWRVWGALAGLLKARTGAHEVITTIMFNFIALFMVDYLLKTVVFQQPGRNDPISKPAEESARVSRRCSADYR